MICTRCSGEGFLNAPPPETMPAEARKLLEDGEHAALVVWMGLHGGLGDMQVCDCCGDGAASWHGEPGRHYGEDDPPGARGPYAYNGGAAECA